MASDILIVKLSSLGDVIHALPAAQDVRRAFPQARIDWVVERAFAPLLRRVTGLNDVIECDWRRWAKAPLSADSWRGWRDFRSRLQARPYDAVLDLQGLTKSALVARTARLSPTGHRYALGNRTDGAGWEPTTRWLADRPITLPAHVHALTRSRELCARALGYPMHESIAYGLPQQAATDSAEVVLLTGSSRADKAWPDDHWFDLGGRLLTAGHTLALAHGSPHEEALAHSLAARWGVGDRVRVWQRMDLSALVERLAQAGGAIGVDSGPSHLAVALGLPHVQIYRHPTSWRTGPLHNPRQRSVEDLAIPSVDGVWQAWLDVSARALKEPSSC